MKEYFHLFFYYSSMIIEKRVEALVYDLGGFLSAAGGNMGLWLGLSFLTILFTCLDWIRSALTYFNEKLKPTLSVEPIMIRKY